MIPEKPLDDPLTKPTEMFVSVLSVLHPKPFGEIRVSKHSLSVLSVPEPRDSQRNGIVLGKTGGWLDALHNHEAKKKGLRSTAAAYRHRDNGPQDNGAEKFPEALESATDKTDNNPNRLEVEMGSETLARYGNKVKGPAATIDEAHDEVRKHNVRGGRWLCQKQGRFPLTENGKGGRA